MPNFSKQLLENINDPAIREETARSLARRGLAGHFLAGLYRTIARPIATRRLLLQAHLANFFWGMDDVCMQVEHLPERYINQMLRTFGGTIDDTAQIRDGLRLINASRAYFEPLHIGYKAFLGENILIDLAQPIYMGDRCTLGQYSMYISHIDVAHSPLKAELYPVHKAAIKIGRGVFIGVGAIVSFGVTIGENSIIGANSVVINDIPPYSLAAGMPAKVIKDLDRTKVPHMPDDQALIIPEGTTWEDFDRR